MEDNLAATELRSIAIKYFTKQSGKAFYEASRKIKYQVFVTEFGWSSLKDESGKAIARVDPFDQAGHFFLAMTEGGLPMGMVRAFHLKRGFPHRDLFEHHCCHSEFSYLMDSVCTLNSLAVLPEYRRKQFRISDQGWSGSAARLLMLSIIRHMEQHGVEAAILTTDGIVPTRLCHGLGFYIIDNPIITDLRPEPLVNMGLVFGSTPHACAQRECGMRPLLRNRRSKNYERLLSYFESCEQHALAGRKWDSIHRNSCKGDDSRD